jgi:hypothetical protein
MALSLSSVIDVAIVLVGLYVLLSSICSYGNEQLSLLLQLRGRKLFLGVVNLVFSQPLAEQIFAHPLIDSTVNDKGGIQRSTTAPNRPPYIDPHNFAIAFWDALADAATVAPANRAAASAAAAAALPAGAVANLRLAASTELIAMRTAAAAAPANGTGPLSSAAHFEDLRQVVAGLPQGNLKANVLAVFALAADYESLLRTTEDWFNRQMDRVTGWYKREAQYIVVAFALVITLFTGLDSLEIAQRLYTAPALLSSAAAQISGAYHAPAPATSPNPDTAQLASTALKLFDGDDFRSFFHPMLAIFGSGSNSHVLGCLITALAVSLGAPFWFDVLGKLVNVRATGPKPESKTAGAQ